MRMTPIVGFQHEHEAQAFLHDLQERLREFGLNLAPGENPAESASVATRPKSGSGAERAARNVRLPWLHALRHAITQMGLVRHRAQDDQEEDAGHTQGESRWSCAKECTTPSKRTGAWVRQLLQGYLNYFAVAGNDRSLWWFLR